MEAASLVLRTLTGLTSGLAAGVVLGAAVPVIAPARGDTTEVRMASCVLASLVAAAYARSAVAEASTLPPVTAPA
jgi:phosphotransacetylase